MTKLISLSKDDVKSIKARSPAEFVIKLWNKILYYEGKTFDDIDKVSVKDYQIPKDVLITAYNRLLEFGPDAGFWGINYFPDIE